MIISDLRVSGRQVSLGDDEWVGVGRGKVLDDGGHVLDDLADVGADAGVLVPATLHHDLKGPRRYQSWEKWLKNCLKSLRDPA